MKRLKELEAENQRLKRIVERHAPQVAQDDLALRAELIAFSRRRPR